MLNYLLWGLILGAILLDYPFSIFLIIIFIICLCLKKTIKEIKYFLFGLSFSFIFSLLARLDLFNRPSILIVLEVHDNYLIATNLLKKYYIYARDSNFEVHDIIKINGTIKKISMHAIESHFDFQQYLNRQGIFYEIYCTDIKIVFPAIVKKIKLIKSLCNNFDTSTAQYVSSLVFGKKRSNFDLFETTSFSYLLTLNSFYITCLLNIVGAFLNKIQNKYLKAIMSFLFIPYFFLICNVKCVQRIIIYYLIKRYIRNVSYYTRIKYILLIFLLVSPFSIYNIGLVFSLSIMAFRYFIFKKTSQKLLRYLLISLFIMFFNYLINGTINLTFTFIRALLIPILFIYYISLLMTCFSLRKFDFSLYTNTINKMLNVFQKIDVQFSFYKVFDIFVILVILILIYSIYINHKKLFTCTLLLVSQIYIVMISPLNNVFYDYLYFIDVGQGDSALIVHKNKTILIDTGGVVTEDIATTTLIPFFNKARINKIDYLIITHNDYDHMGALESLCQNFKVQNILKNQNDFPLVVNDLTIENLNNYAITNKNDSSIINRFDFIGYNWLFLGDVSSTIEKKIVNDYDLEDVDIIKIAHHGSNTSTCAELLDASTPQQVVISLGYKNKFKFPSSEVLNRLNERNIKIRRTDVEGTIIYKSFKF